MAFVATQGIWMPEWPRLSLLPSSQQTVIDATGEKFAWIGRVWNKDRATKSVTKVGFRFGPVTKSGGSALTVSLQDVDLANGPPFQPDGTQDQTVAIANADAGFASNVWYQTGNFSADRSVSFGELLAVVIEYDGSGRLSSDSVQISNHSLSNGNQNFLNTGIALYTASWAHASNRPNILLEFSDGTFGTLDGAFPASSITGSVAFNADTNPDENALEFTVPFPCKVDGAWIVALVASATANFEVVLYAGTTALATVPIDANTAYNTGGAAMVIVPFSEVTLSPGTTYRLAVKATVSAQSVTIYYFNVAAAGHFQAHAGGTSWVYNTRNDGGSWGTATATRRPFAGIRISALDAGGAIGHGNMTGGMQ